MPSRTQKITRNLTDYQGGFPESNAEPGSPSKDHSSQMVSESERKRKVLEEAASILGVPIPSLPEALKVSMTVPETLLPAPLASSSAPGRTRQYDPIQSSTLGESQGVTTSALHSHFVKSNVSWQGAGEAATFPQWMHAEGAAKEVEIQQGFRDQDRPEDYIFDPSAIGYPGLDLSATELDFTQPAPGMDPQDLERYFNGDTSLNWDDNTHTRALEPSLQADWSSPAAGAILDCSDIARFLGGGMTEVAPFPKAAELIQRGDSASDGRGDYQATLGESEPSKDPADKESKKRKRRAKFKDSQKRRQTGHMRIIGACIRCHMQRVRCERGEDDDPQAPCLTCRKLQGPTLSGLPCLRYKITDASLFAKGNHPRFIWTHRWKSMAIVEIAEWQSDDIKEVSITQGVGRTHYNLQVRQFIPEEGDSLARHWSSCGESHSYKCAPYAIANMHQTAQELEQFVDDNVNPAIEFYIGETDKLLRDTYMMAQKYSVVAPTIEERELLQNVLRLWNAIRMESMSEFICSDETLGMSPQHWDSKGDSYGRVLVPPVISAQIQLLMTVKVMQPLKRSVLRALQKLVEKNDPETWFTRYLCMFILLHSCALLTSHENRRAKKSGLQSRYITRAFVEELHEGAKILLAFFHYCNKGGHPFATDFWNSSCHVAMAKLDEEQLGFLRTTSEQIRKKGPLFKEIRKRKVFEHDYFFLAQLFDVEWKPMPTI